MNKPTLFKWPINNLSKKITLYIRNESIISSTFYVEGTEIECALEVELNEAKNDASHCYDLYLKVTNFANENQVKLWWRVWVENNCGQVVLPKTEGEFNLILIDLTSYVQKVLNYTQRIKIFGALEITCLIPNSIVPISLKMILFSFVVRLKKSRKFRIVCWSNMDLNFAKSSILFMNKEFVENAQLKWVKKTSRYFCRSLN